MFNYTIMLYVLALPFVLGGIAFGLFPRKTKNILMRLIPAWNKRYVICHVKFTGGMSEDYLVVPNLQGLTAVGKYMYQLTDKYICLTWKKRNHFILDEADSIPRNFEIQTKDSIIFQAAEIQTALNNSVMEYLFSRKKEIIIICLFILVIIAIFAIVYNVTQLNEFKTILQAQTAPVIVGELK